MNDKVGETMGEACVSFINRGYHKQEILILNVLNTEDQGALSTVVIIIL